MPINEPEPFKEEYCEAMCEMTAFFYERRFHHEDSPGCGCSFPCDDQGNVDRSNLHPNAIANLDECLTGEKQIVDETAQCPNWICDEDCPRCFGSGVIAKSWKPSVIIDEGAVVRCQVWKCCPCGSKKYRCEEYDGRGIHLFFHCEDCYAGKIAKVNPVVLGSYTEADVDERIEPED